MSAEQPQSPVEQASLPSRSATLHSTGTNLTRQTSASDDEGLVGDDTSETTRLLLERLRAWKHLCGYLEDYVEATAKVQKSQAKDYEKVLKTINNPLKEGHHFHPGPGGVTGMFDNLRKNTQAISTVYLETEKNLKKSVLPTLEHLHKEIKTKSKEISSGTSKLTKAVDKARTATQKHVELLGQYAAVYDAGPHNKIEPSHDPYVLRRGVTYRLNKQITEENNSRRDILAVQDGFQQFEAHIIQTIHQAMDSFFGFMGALSDKQRALYGDMVSSAQKVPLDFEWTRFVQRSEGVLIDPDSPPRTLASVPFPNQDHPATLPRIEGTLERKSRAVIRGYQSAHYVVTPARYLHEFKDTDDLQRDPAPELSLYLPDCQLSALDGVKFVIKGKDVSGGKVTNAFHTTSELQFKAPTPNDAEAWWRAIKAAIDGHRPSPPAEPAAEPAAATPTEPEKAKEDELEKTEPEKDKETKA
ncbi:hypothetical protein VTN49DRAFT_6633 [Thermomyces lanuginosus]|uniref:uncharacterized protein n=1 Tax=Thermomyces lanuginosus TaxID=5541 RepID=UPI003743B6A0